MDIVKTLAKIEQNVQKGDLTAAKRAEMIARMKIGCNSLSDIELCECAVCFQRIFFASDTPDFADVESANYSITAYENIISRGGCDVSIYEMYIFLLELTYQYEKSYELLKQLYAKPQFYVSALKFLSGFCYYANGFVSMDEHMKYEKESIKYGQRKVERRQSDAEDLPQPDGR
jgi:hypothetical protein